MYKCEKCGTISEPNISENRVVTATRHKQYFKNICKKCGEFSSYDFTIEECPKCMRKLEVILEGEGDEIVSEEVRCSDCVSN